MRRRSAGALTAAIGIALSTVTGATVVGASAGRAAAAATVPRYDHVFLVVMENHGYKQIIGNPAAPTLNALAAHYGVATDYYSVADPSEPNYVAMLGGSTFGINSDNPYWDTTVDAPSLPWQLQQAGLTWRAYLQGMPYAGYRGACFPVRCNGIPDSDSLYSSKHDGIVNFADLQTPAELADLHPIADLSSDLAADDVPSFSYIVPDQCSDMHGAPPYCVDAAAPGGVDDTWLVSSGDAFVNQVVGEIQRSAVWSQGNDAIVVTFDEGNGSAGCCGVRGTGRVATIVVTNHGPRGLQDATPYDHYSLLATLEQLFGVPCLRHACDPASKDMAPLFAVSGSTSVPALPAPYVQAPSGTGAPTPISAEVAGPAVTTSCSAWDVTPTPDLTRLDNVLASVSAASADDVWAVGSYYAGGAPSVLRALGLHFDGVRWTAVGLPDAGVNENSLLGVSALADGDVWAVGYYATPDLSVRALVEREHQGSWSVLTVPAAAGAERVVLFSVKALSEMDVWAVGGLQDAAGSWQPLVEHWDGARWSVVPAPDLGDAGGILYSVDGAAPDQVVAVGVHAGTSYSGSGLVESWDGAAFLPSLVAAAGGATGALYGVAVGPDGASVVGTAEDDRTDQTTLAAYGADGGYSLVPSANVNVHENDLYTVASASASAGGSAWAAGWAVTNAASGAHEALLEQQVGGVWRAVAAPPVPGAGGTNGFASLAAVPGGGVWAVGEQSTAAGNPQTFAAYHC